MRTNAVVLLQAMHTEAAEPVAAALSSLPPDALSQINFVACDNPSNFLKERLHEVCPNLQMVSLDPVHLAFAWEYSTWKKRTAGSRALRAVLSKLSQRDPARGADAWGEVYHGSSAFELTAAEEVYRDNIRHSSMPIQTARRILKDMDYSTPFAQRLHFIQALAALSAAHADEASKIAPGPNRKVRELLWGAASADRLEWYLNNTRARHCMKSSHHSMLHVGTSSNEALHREINAWFRETQQIHQATLKLKLFILQHAKLLSHNAAMYHHTSSQHSQATVLARAASLPAWTLQQWRAWCPEKTLGTIPPKADLPLHRERQSQQEKVRTAESQGSRQGKLTGKVKRTPFSLERRQGLRRGGVRPTIHKRPAAAEKTSRGACSS
ncbi:unnamed protein product [Effrenium voratum]|nr:unnamed protein product [Effrenium voratum]CAJ1434659.1 unnamed protein product [Effrenium voratum]CAJ1450892.1 unnamed protein product [Effrenium voratum]